MLQSCIVEIELVSFSVMVVTTTAAIAGGWFLVIGSQQSLNLFFAAIGVHHMYQMETSFHLISCSFQQLEKALAGQYIFACTESANV